jgi:hypothetical protein
MDDKFTSPEPRGSSKLMNAERTDWAFARQQRVLQRREQLVMEV